VLTEVGDRIRNNWKCEKKLGKDLIGLVLKKTINPKTVYSSLTPHISYALQENA